MMGRGSVCDKVTAVRHGHLRNCRLKADSERLLEEERQRRDAASAEAATQAEARVLDESKRQLEAEKQRRLAVRGRAPKCRNERSCAATAGAGAALEANAQWHCPCC